MRPIAVVSLALFLPSFAAAQPAGQTVPHHAGRAGHGSHGTAHPTRPGHPAGGPRSIGVFDDWQAATHAEGGQTVCYAFVRSGAPHAAAAGNPATDGAVLTVTERPTGRDAVALSVGFTYPPNASVTMRVGRTSLDFYTSRHSAFARDGHAAVSAFARGSTAVAQSPGPRGTTLSDSFSLRGFPAAYAAINKACPAR